MVHPLITTPILLGSALLTGVLLQYSWWTGVPALILMIPVIGWHSNHAMLSYQQLRIRHRYFIFFVMVASGIASITCAHFWPVAVKTLTVLHLSVLITHDRLLHYDFGLSKQKKSAKCLLAVFAPLSLLGTVSVGIVFNLSVWAAIPCCTLLQYSLYFTGVSMHHTKIVKHPRVFSIIIFALLIGLLAAFFVAYILAPFFWPLTAAAVYHAYFLLASNEMDMHGTIASLIRVFSWLQPVGATSVGVAIALNLDDTPIMIFLALLEFIAIVQLLLLEARDVANFKKNLPIPAVNKPNILIGAIVVIFLLQIACSVALHFILASLRFAVPAIFFAQALGYVISVHMLDRLKHMLTLTRCKVLSYSMIAIGILLTVVAIWLHAAKISSGIAIASSAWIIIMMALQFVSISDGLHKIQKLQQAAATAAQAQPAVPAAAAAAQPEVTYDSDYESGGSQLSSDDDDDDDDN